MRVRSLVFSSDGAGLGGEIVEPDGEPSWTVILCHGIPGKHPKPDDQGYAGFARALAAEGLAAAWFNFRGCRDAPGDFSIAGWARDLGAATGAVARDARAPIAYVGSSAGGATAICVAAERDDVAAVATLAAPASYEGISTDVDGALHQFRNLGIIRDPGFPRDPAAWGAEFDTYSPIGSIGKLSPRPVLLVHGDADDVVPYAHAEILFEQAGEPKELVRVPRAGHQLRLDARAIDALVDWLDRVGTRARG